MAEATARSGTLAQRVEAVRCLLSANQSGGPAGPTGAASGQRPRPCATATRSPGAARREVPRWAGAPGSALTIAVPYVPVVVAIGRPLPQQRIRFLAEWVQPDVGVSAVRERERRNLGALDLTERDGGDEN